MNKFKMFTLIFLVSIFVFMINGYIIPCSITLDFDEKCFFDVQKLPVVSLKISDNPISSVELTKKNGKLFIIPKTKGITKLDLILFDYLKIKEVLVNVVKEEKVIPMGKAVGIRLYLDGVYIEAVTGVEGMDGQKHNPIKTLGIKKGDIIIEANDSIIKNTLDLIKELEKNPGEKVKLKYKRGEKIFFADIKPIKSIDNKYHIGIWVKDIVNGIGTVTFCMEDSGKFGALGHGISSENENGLLNISGGEIFETQIYSIKKSSKGVPGELKGNLMMNYNVIGEIKTNNNYGLFGYLYNDYIEKNKSNSVSIGYKEFVKVGKAIILVNVEKNVVESFEIEIQKIVNKPESNDKGMIIKITDKKLIEKTGGIVQGMSGSPILQNNRLIGAITHVLINDPYRGYGIFIENMIKK